jgi:ribosomal protein S27AE
MREEFIEEMEFSDKVRDAYTHRRLVLFFSKVLYSGKSFIVVKPRCPLCGRTWKEKAFYDEPDGSHERKMQAWVSSIMSRHFKEHGFNMVKEASGSPDMPNSYRCPRCGDMVVGLLHAIAHFITCQRR